MRRVPVLAGVLAAVLTGSATGAAGPATAAAAAGSAAAAPAPARTPVATPTPEPRLPGEPVGGPRLGSSGVNLPAGSARVPTGISARAWVLADLDSGEVLAARNAHGRYPPASTQKWLTALTLLPLLPDRKKRVVVTDADVNVEGTRVGLVARGKYPVEVLFFSMLMASGNDSANALARIAGGVPRTLAAMNAEAERLRAYDTHAETPSGLDGPGQLTSAYDLALIARAGLARADFRRYTAQRRGRIPTQSPRYQGFEFANNNRLLYNYPGAFSGKNGFTDAARHTFIGAAKRGDRRLVVTMMYGEHRPTHISEQAGRLLDWGFALRPTAGPVGVLVDPVDPDAPPPPTPAPSGAASPSAPPVRTAGAGADAGGGPPVALVAGGIAGFVILGWAGVALARRRRRT